MHGIGLWYTAATWHAARPASRCTKFSHFATTQIQLQNQTTWTLAIANRLRVSCAHNSEMVTKMTFNSQPRLSAINRTHDFPLPFGSNYGPILYHFLHVASYWSKIANFIFISPTCIQCCRRELPRRNSSKMFDIETRGQSNLTKSASRGANSPVRGHPRGSKVVPLNSWGRVSY